MSRIPVARAQFLIPFAEICSELGAPSAPLLAKFRLPTSLTEKADDFVPLQRAIEFVERAQRSQDIVDFGFQAAKRLQFCHLSVKLKTVIGHSPTLFYALEQLCRWAAAEHNVLRIWLELSEDHVKICSTLAGASKINHLEHSQWLQNILLIHIVRRFVGPAWSPSTIAFEANYSPTMDTRSEWPSTRFLSEQFASWIEVPIAFLSVSGPSGAIQPEFFAEESEIAKSEIINSLRLMLPSYLDEQIPTVAEVAEMASTSVRSLQRELTRVGLPYSALVETMRFEKAEKLLRNTNIKIIEVAFAAGYSDPAHFSRAFRRMSGMSPRQFRKNCSSE